MIDSHIDPLRVVNFTGPGDEATTRRISRLFECEPLIPVPPDKRRSLGGWCDLHYQVARMPTVVSYLATCAAGPRRAVRVAQLDPMCVHHPESLASFRDQIELASRLDHPFVLRFLEAVSYRDIHCMVTEYAVGQSLAQVGAAMAAGPPVRGRGALIARIVSDLAEGLHAVHEADGAGGTAAGVGYGEFSPYDLMALYDGTVRLAAFGTASSSAAGSPNNVLGAAYCAPEILMGRPPDRRAHVWSMGVVLWELFAQRRLFARPLLVPLMEAVLDAPMPPPSHHAGDVSAELDAVVACALRRDPDERYPDARALAVALDRACASGGQTCGHADVAAFMRELFPNGEQYHREAIRHALTATTEPDHITPRRLLAAAPVPAAADEPIDVGFPLDDAPEEDTFAPRAPGLLRRRMAAATIGVAGVAVLATVLTLALRRGDPAPRRSTSASAASAVFAEGEVIVTSGGVPAEVFLAGRRVGTTATRLRLPAGFFELTVAPVDGSAPVTAWVDIVADTTRLVQIGRPTAH